ncbi:hypothetical protein D3C80_2076530 [compost metagenome]
MALAVEMPWVWAVWAASAANKWATIQKETEINKFKLYLVAMAILHNYLMACKCPKMLKGKV